MRLKSRTISLVACLALASVTTGCFGKFALTRKLYGWNDSFDNKFVKTIVFWAFNIIPVYGVLGTADFLVLNLIEFWSGSNPVANVAPEVQPDGSIKIERDGVALLLKPAGDKRFEIYRGAELVGTAMMTGDRGLVFTQTASGQVVRVTGEEVRDAEPMAQKIVLQQPAM